MKGRETWNAVVDIYKKHCVWLNNEKEVERWQEEQDQKRVEKLVHERLQQEQFQCNQKGKGKKPTNPGKGWAGSKTRAGTTSSGKKQVGTTSAGTTTRLAFSRRSKRKEAS